MKKLALLWGLSLLVVVGATRPSTAPAAVMVEPQAVTDEDQDDNDDGTPAEETVCADKGETCLSQGAPKCCKGLRCVGYVCKK